MFSDYNKTLMKNAGKRLGFFTGLLIFSSLLFFVGIKSRIIPVGTSYYTVISLVVLLHVAYSVTKVIIKND